MLLKKKLLLTMISLAIIPIVILGIIATISIAGIGSDTEKNVYDIGNRSIVSSGNSLQKLGEELIKTQGEAVSKEIGIYLNENPDKTIADLQKDAFFQELAIQPVGKTGYTAVHNVDTFINYFHKNPKNVGMDLRTLRNKFPEFVSLLEKGSSGNTGGQYDWPEADGSVRQKYMFISVAQGKTADNVRLAVAATTYLDEFSAPAKELEASINADNANLVTTIAGAFNQTILLIFLVLVITAVVVGIIALKFATDITAPLGETVNMIKELGKGHLSGRLNLTRKDEIGTLSQEMDHFAQYLQHNVVQTMKLIAEGKETDHIEVIDEKDEIGPALIRMTTTLDALIDETSQITTQATSGNLSVKGDISRFEGRYKDIIVGFNSTLHTLIAPLQEAISLSREYADGNYTARFKQDVTVQGDLIPFRDALNRIGEKNSSAMNEVKQNLLSMAGNMEETNASLEGVVAASHELSNSSIQVSQFSEKNAENISQIQGTMDDLSSTVSMVAQKTSEVSQISQKTNELSKRGAILAQGAEERMQSVMSAVQNSATLIQGMDDHMLEIIKIIDIITAISEQTNLLALNAAIEAARAGEAGLGFAVVAGEVKNLAQEAQESAEHINKMISDLKQNTREISQGVALSTQEAKAGNTAVNETMKVFDEIVSLIDEIATRVEQVAAATEEEAASVQEITANITEMKQFSSNIEDLALGVSAASEETTAALDQISNAVNDASVSISKISGEMDIFKTE